MRDSYAEALKAYTAKQDEESLVRAQDVGRELVIEDVPTEEIAEMHEEALHRFAEESPNIISPEAIRLISPPLMEVLMAYGLAFREQIHRRSRLSRSRLTKAETKVGEGEECIRKKNQELEAQRRAALNLARDAEVAKLKAQQAEGQIQRLNEELEQRIVSRTAQVEATNKELETFAYSVSHDLRAPLRRMDGFSRALLQGHADKVDEEGKHYLKRICAGSQLMGGLIDDLLDLSSITRRELKHGRFDLGVIALQVAEDLQESEPDRDVEFVFPKEVIADGDEHLLRVALQNVVGNAWKFTSKTEKKGRIEFGAARNAECGARNAELGDDVMVYFVRDNGAGFDMAYANKLFGAFQRLHRENEFEGTGIGLATVQRIIHKHGGRIWAEGALGKGATFYFTLGLRSERGMSK